MAVYNDVVRQKIDEYWQRLVEEKKLDIIHQAFEASKAKAERRIDVDTLEHKDARDIGAEWLCLQMHNRVGSAVHLERDMPKTDASNHIQWHLLCLWANAQ